MPSAWCSCWRWQQCPGWLGAKGFRELGDQAQELLAALGGAPYPLRQKVIASSETSGRFGKVACDESVVGEDDRSGGEFGCVHRFEGSDGC
jgi:hypothetical protein